MLSQQSLLSLCVLDHFVWHILKVVEFGSFEKGYLNQPPSYAGSKLSSLC